VKLLLFRNSGLVLKQIGFSIFEVIGFSIFLVDPPFEAKWILDSVLNPVSAGILVWSIREREGPAH
jgi:hypothetical protein